MPSAVSAPIAATETRVVIRLYSMAVAPFPSFTKWARVVIMLNNSVVRELWVREVFDPTAVEEKYMPFDDWTVVADLEHGAHGFFGLREVVLPGGAGVGKGLADDVLKAGVHEV